MIAGEALVRAGAEAVGLTGGSLPQQSHWCCQSTTQRPPKKFNGKIFQEASKSALPSGQDHL